MVGFLGAGEVGGRRVSQTAWMLFGPQGAWAEQLKEGPWTVEDLMLPFAGWQGAYLRWRPETWPLDAERYLLVASIQHRLPLLGCYVCVSCFGNVVALVPGAIVARYVVDPDGTQAWVEGEWALAQCAADHGLAWMRTGLEALARWSRVAPRPQAAEQLHRLLAGYHLFPEHPLFGELPVALGIQPAP
jgi:hypothetical protein